MGRRVVIHLDLLVLLNQLGVDLEILDVELRMETPNLLLAQVKALAKVLGSCLFHSLLEII